MEEEKDAFYVVRKGDVIGIYKNLNDCQDQVSSSVTDPSVSVYKGYSLPKESEDFLKSHGLKDALYTIPAADVKDGIFGQLIPCPFQQPSSSQEPLTGSIQPCPHPSGGKQAEKVSPRKRSRDEIDDGPNNMLSCTLQFDGASKGNPGLAGAGAVLRSEDGTVYRLREGVGVATNNVAEYRALILGLRHAIKVGFKKIRIQGDSKLVCCQVNGEWKIKHQSMASLCKVVNDLKTKFTSFQINHILREYNSEADGLANLALNLKDGQVEVECIRK